MKTINQLKKEIKEYKKYPEKSRLLWRGLLGIQMGLIDLAQAKLQTLQEVCEEIKKVILNIGAEQSDKHLQGMEIFEIEILNKLKGDEE